MLYTHAISNAGLFYVTLIPSLSSRGNINRSSWSIISHSSTCYHFYNPKWQSSRIASEDARTILRTRFLCWTSPPICVLSYTEKANIAQKVLQEALKSDLLVYEAVLPFASRINGSIARKSQRGLGGRTPTYWTPRMKLLRKKRIAKTGYRDFALDLLVHSCRSRQAVRRQLSSYS